MGSRLFISAQNKFLIGETVTGGTSNATGVITDYTANLVISRMKFSIGQASVVGFKVKSKGFQGATDSFIGDGSTTAFSPVFDVQDKGDVKVI